MCDDCIECSCSSEWCACTGDSGVDDAGVPTGCTGYVDCVQVCGFPPVDSGVSGGTLQQCAQQCGAAYPQQQVQEGNALLSCVASNCSSATTCGG